MVKGNIETQYAKNEKKRIEEGKKAFKKNITNASNYCNLTVSIFSFFFLVQCQNWYSRCIFHFNMSIQTKHSDFMSEIATQMMH